MLAGSGETPALRADAVGGIGILGADGSTGAKCSHIPGVVGIAWGVLSVSSASNGVTTVNITAIIDVGVVILAKLGTVSKIIVVVVFNGGFWKFTGGGLPALVGW